MSPVLLAVDPGVRGSGVALFTGATLTACAYVTGSKEGKRAAAWVPMAQAVRNWCASFHHVDEVVSEYPQCYRERKLKGDPQDLIELAAVVGAVLAKFDQAKHTVYLPREWKGQVLKTIHHERALKRLTPDEIARLGAGLVTVPRSLQHNALDALALGLVHLKRL